MQLSKGVLYMIASAFLFSVMTLFVKLIGERLPSIEIVFIRNAISLLLTAYLLYKAQVAPWGNRKGLLLVRGFAGFFALLCFFYAIPRLPLAEVTVLHFSNPLFVALLAPLVLKESVEPKVLGALIISIVGILLVTQPAFLSSFAEARLDYFVVGIALLGAMFTAIAYLTVRELRTTEHVLVVVLYFPLVSVPASFPLVVTNMVWPTGIEWLLLFGIGGTTQIAQIFLTKGLHTESASRATSVSYIQIVFAALWGWLFFQELPNGLSVFGMILIVGGLFLISRRS